MRKFKVTASINGKPASDFIVSAESDVDAMDIVLAQHQGCSVEIFTVYEAA